MLAGIVVNNAIVFIDYINFCGEWISDGAGDY